MVCCYNISNFQEEFGLLQFSCRGMMLEVTFRKKRPRFIKSRMCFLQSTGSYQNNGVFTQCITCIQRNTEAPVYLNCFSRHQRSFLCSIEFYQTMSHLEHEFS